MYIKNYQILATSEARKMALDIIEAGIAAAHPRALMEKTLRYNETFNSLTVQNNTFDIITGRIFVVGAGKAAGLMAEAFEMIVGADHITAGFINCPDDNYKLKKIKAIKASHPLPDNKGIRGAEKMLDLKEKYDIGEKDLVVCLLSGGGSALLPCPADGVSLKDKQAATQILLESGATIREINTIRKHLSKTKGGQLGGHFSPAKVVSIIISDVAGNDLSVVASGPTVADPTTFKDALLVLDKHGLTAKVPPGVSKYIKDGCAGQKGETPKNLNNCENFVIGDVRTSLEEMALKARTFGLRPLIATAELNGETEQSAIDIAAKIEKNEFSGYNLMLFGGETTPKLPSKYGQGGRNQHFAAVSMFALAKLKRDWVMASFTTDGVDYSPLAAGAVVDQGSLDIARRDTLGVEKYITDYDTASLFKKMKTNLIVTGQTGTNVGDVVIYLLK